ncbi:MAG: TIGR02584 family CRISPR-associated protein [Verrucomicrobiaceae bacterium]|nr:TIGR02584 family CRISPR-associated protein [Verrucomicrobiaceae bacterium]
MPATLIAVTGLSPAIVTETLWALAQEKPRILPARVVFITTLVGAGKIQEQLLTPLPAFDGQTAWQALRAKLKAKEHELIAEAPRVIGQANKKTGTFDALPDIQTPEQNTLAAAFILEEVRRVVENPDTPLIASIAGGRKTMGALLHAAVTLIGREDDRLTHVLVDAPYETMPGFYFPGQPGPALKDRDGKEHPPAKARVHLADVPFVPLRNRFKELDDMPGSFDALRRKFSRELKEDAARPRLIEISHRKRTFWVDEQPMKMRSSALALLHFMLEQAEVIRDMGKQEKMLDPLNAWLKEDHGIPLGLKPLQMSLGEITRQLSHLRTTLRENAAAWQIPSRFPIQLPPALLRLKD